MQFVIMFSLQFSICLIFLLITVDAKYYQVTPGLCRMNERYSPCTQLCPPTCDNPNSECRVDCTRSACNCIPGYVYNNEGQCIPSNSCLRQRTSRCNYNIDCGSGFSCVNGFCSHVSGSVSGTVFSSYSSSSSAHRLQSQSYVSECSCDKHCPGRKMCINGLCKLHEELSRVY